MLARTAQGWDSASDRGLCRPHSIPRGLQRRSDTGLRDGSKERKIALALLPGERLACAGRMTATITHEINNRRRRDEPAVDRQERQDIESAQRPLEMADPTGAQ